MSAFRFPDARSKPIPASFSRLAYETTGECWSDFEQKDLADLLLDNIGWKATPEPLLVVLQRGRVCVGA